MMRKVIYLILFLFFPFTYSQANTTPQPLPFTQNWTDPSLIIVNNNWNNVPGISGFGGGDLFVSSGTDPQTITGSSAQPPVVLANQFNPDLLAVGGVAEFDAIANPTVALQPAGAVSAPHLILYLNTTNYTNIHVAYNLRDIDGSADNAVQAVALQYRIGSVGNFINFPAGFVVDDTSGPSLATMVTAVKAVLPADANNQIMVQVRIITALANGSNEWVGVDDINISGTAINPPPVITTTTGTNIYVFGAAIAVDNGLTVTDANNTTLASATVKMTTGFQSGTDILQFTSDGATMGNITGIADPPNGVVTLSSAGATATLAQWQAALRAVKYNAVTQPSTHNVTVSFTANDGTSSGSAATKNIAVYDEAPPVVTTTATVDNYIHPTPIAIDNGITVSDANNPTLPSCKVSFSSSFQPGSDMLSFTNNPSTMGNIAGNYNANTGILNLTSSGATATLAQWQAALRTVTYYAAITPQVYDRTISFVLNDYINDGIPATKTIQIAPSQSPVVSTTSGTTTYQHATPVIIDGGITVSDPDNTTLYSATLTFTGSFENGVDRLSFSNDGSSMGNIVGNFITIGDTLTLTSAGATATFAQWQAALRSVMYYYNAGPVFNSYNRTVKIVVSDGSTNSAPATKTITFMPLASIAQTWSNAVQVLDPNGGVLGYVGDYSKMLVVDGNPAIAYYDNLRHNLVFSRATDASGTAFGIGVTLDSMGDVGKFISLSIVSGNPAITYYDATNADLKYDRALDADGTKWGSPISVDINGNVGEYTSLQIVNGNPAIAYYDVTNANLKFVRSSDATGATWGSPLSIDMAGDVGQYASMQIVNGNPAIAYYDATNHGLKYVRASDASGTGWNSALILDSAGGAGTYASMQIINGNPAIAYSALYSIHFLRASDNIGAVWGTPVAVALVNNSAKTHASLQLVNNRPAISFRDESILNRLIYCRALDAFGLNWGSLQQLEASSATGAYSCMQIVNGNPAVAYKDGYNQDVKFIRATDGTGTNWASPVSIDSWGEAGTKNNIQMVNGKPAMVFKNNRGIYYVRALNAEGTSWAAPVLLENVYTTGYSSMAVVNGYPAVVYGESTYLKYIRATDSAGTSWAAPKNIDTNFLATPTITLLVVNGYPAVMYDDGRTLDNFHTAYNLVYMRASDSSGLGYWNTRIELDDQVKEPRMLVANGKPAVVYRKQDVQQNTSSLKYIVAADSSGKTWNANAMLTLDGYGNTGYTPSIKIINGKPAVAYQLRALSGLQYAYELKYISASDPSGTSWNYPLTVRYGGNLGSDPLLESINNIPVIAYEDLTSNQLKYITSTDPTGVYWNEPTVLDSFPNFIPGYYSMVVSGNYVGFAYYNSLQAVPYYIPGHYGFTSLNTDYFRSKQNGNWNISGSWESSHDNINWGSATLTPDYTANTITIRASHTIKVTANVTADQLVLQPACILNTKPGVNFVIK